MLHLQQTKTVRTSVALSDVFEAFVEAERPQHRCIGFGVFDATGTVVDRLLAVLPKAAAPLESTPPPAAAKKSLLPDNPQPPPRRCPHEGG